MNNPNTKIRFQLTLTLGKLCKKSLFRTCVKFCFVLMFTTKASLAVQHQDWGDRNKICTVLLFQNWTHSVAEIPRKLSLLFMLTFWVRPSGNPYSAFFKFYRVQVVFFAFFSKLRIHCLTPIDRSSDAVYSLNNEASLCTHTDWVIVVYCVKSLLISRLIYFPSWRSELKICQDSQGESVLSNLLGTMAFLWE